VPENTQGAATVPVIVRQLQLPESKPVYNLSIERDHVYYANGILVSNCAIAVEGARQRGFLIARMEPDHKVNLPDERWKEELRERARKAKQSYALTYK